MIATALVTFRNQLVPIVNQLKKTAKIHFDNLTLFSSDAYIHNISYVNYYADAYPNSNVITSSIFIQFSYEIKSAKPSMAIRRKIITNNAILTPISLTPFIAIYIVSNIHITQLNIPTVLEKVVIMLQPKDRNA